jgi:hypothetical protein
MVAQLIARYPAPSPTSLAPQIPQTRESLFQTLYYCHKIGAGIDTLSPAAAFRHHQPQSGPKRLPTAACAFGIGVAELETAANKGVTADGFVSGWPYHSSFKIDKRMRARSCVHTSSSE